MDVLRNEVGEEALYAGIMTLGAAKMKCNKTKHVRYFITKYITSPTNYNHNLSLSDALLLSRLDKHVTFFAQAFATLAASLIPTTNDFARACSPSRTELGRIKRSFYFFEMYYNLFRLTRVIAPDKRMLFRHFSSWEKEQLATVRNYLLHAIAPSFDDVATHDIIWGSRQVEFAEDPHNEVVGWTEHLLARGLAYLHKVALATTYEQRYTAIACKYPKKRMNNLPLALLYNLDWQEEDDLPGTRDTKYDDLFLSQYGHEEERLIVGTPFLEDEDSDPRDAWFWLHQQSTVKCFFNDPCFKTVRQWGYVMWDRYRLEQAGLFSQPYFPSRSLPPTDSEAELKRMLRGTWERRREIRGNGGTGWWSQDDESKVVWPKGICPELSTSQAVLDMEMSLD